MTTVFVAGSGTGVGKTLVTAALARQLSQCGVKVQALKPVLSGYPSADNQPDDCQVLLQAVGRPINNATIDEVSPWRFQAALSPDMAAALENRSIDFAALLDFCRSAMAKPGWQLIEGIGGVMVPLTATQSVLDWIATLGARTVLVAGSYLGTLSHTLTAVTALRSRQIDVAAIVVSESDFQAVDLAETCMTLKRFANTAVIPVPRLPSPNPWRNAPSLLGVIGGLNLSGDLK